MQYTIAYYDKRNGQTKALPGEHGQHYGLYRVVEQSRQVRLLRVSISEGLTQANS